MSLPPSGFGRSNLTPPLSSAPVLVSALVVDVPVALSLAPLVVGVPLELPPSLVGVAVA